MSTQKFVGDHLVFNDCEKDDPLLFCCLSLLLRFELLLAALEGLLEYCLLFVLLQFLCLGHLHRVGCGGAAAQQRNACGGGAKSTRKP